MEKKTGYVAGRVSAALRHRLDAINARHLTNDSTVVSALLAAFCDEVERQDAVRLPVTILFSERELMVAEERLETSPLKGGYSAKGPPATRRRGAGPAAAVSKSA